MPTELKTNTDEQIELIHKILDDIDAGRVVDHKVVQALADNFISRGDTDPLLFVADGASMVANYSFLLELLDDLKLAGLVRKRLDTPEIGVNLEDL